MTNGYDKASAYRDRQRDNDAWRLQVYLPAEYRQLVTDTATRLGITNKAALQYLLDTATMYDDLTIQNALEQAPNDKVRATIQAAIDADPRNKRDNSKVPAHEQAAFEKLATNIAEAHVEARHLQAHGGQAQLDTQNRIAASWTAGNIHNTK